MIVRARTLSTLAVLISNTGGNIAGMGVQRFGVSFEEQLAAEVQAAAQASGEAVSAWLAEAARRRLAQDGLGALVADWEAEHGAFTEEELAASRRRLGLDKRPQ